MSGRRSNVGRTSRITARRSWAVLIVAALVGATAASAALAVGSGPGPAAKAGKHKRKCHRRHRHRCKKENGGGDDKKGNNPGAVDTPPQGMTLSCPSPSANGDVPVPVSGRIFPAADPFIRVKRTTYTGSTVSVGSFPGPDGGVPDGTYNPDGSFAFNLPAPNSGHAVPPNAPWTLTLTVRAYNSGGDPTAVVQSCSWSST